MSRKAIKSLLHPAMERLSTGTGLPSIAEELSAAGEAAANVQTSAAARHAAALALQTALLSELGKHSLVRRLSQPIAASGGADHYTFKLAGRLHSVEQDVDLDRLFYAMLSGGLVREEHVFYTHLAKTAKGVLRTADKPVLPDTVWSAVAALPNWPGHIVVSGDLLNSIVSNEEWCGMFVPATNEAVLNGQIGELQGIKVWTDTMRFDTMRTFPEHLDMLIVPGAGEEVPRFYMSEPECHYDETTWQLSIEYRMQFRVPAAVTLGAAT